MRTPGAGTVVVESAGVVAGPQSCLRNDSIETSAFFV